MTADPDLSRPYRLCPRVVRNVLDRPFVRALQALVTGFLGTPAPPGVGDRAIAAAATALLGPGAAGPAEIRATAEEGVRLLRERRAAVVALITTRTEPTR